MADPIYVLNQSNLQLHKIVEKTIRGLADLLPGEVGKISAPVAEQERTKIWIEKGRLKVISKEEFERCFSQSPSEEENLAFKAKYQAKQDKDSVVIIPGLDELPEIDKIPEPDVTNLDGTVAVRAPEDNEPLIERAGDPTQVDIQTHHPKKLNVDGSLSEVVQTDEKKVNLEAPKPVVLKDLELPKVEEKPKLEKVEKTEETSCPKNDEPLIESVAPETVETPSVEKPIETPSTAPAGEDSVKKILGLSAWRQQLKAIKKCEDPEVLLAVAEQTSREIIKKACTDRLEILSKK